MIYVTKEGRLDKRKFKYQKTDQVREELFYKRVDQIRKYLSTKIDQSCKIKFI